MANQSLFKSIAGKLLPKTNTVNEAGGQAYQLSPKQQLAQYAITGCLNGTFYATAEDQLQTVLKLCAQLEPEFIARTALYCRQRGDMKDMPALLCAVLSMRAPGLLCEIFDRVIDNGKMLQNFVQIMRSGATGRKSLGTAPKKLVQKWLEHRSDQALFKAAVGQAPSVGDIIKMVHPKPKTPQREALYGYLIGREHNAELLPELVRQFEEFKAGTAETVPDVPFQMLTALELKSRDWIAIAQNASWQMTRMNLNTFARHGVLEHADVVQLLAARLRDREAIKKARAFPYQLLMAYTAVGSNIPAAIVEALQDAMEVAIENVPEIDGKVHVCLDVSGSMRSPLTGLRKGATSAVRCIDVAALVAAALVRKNRGATVVPFSDHVVECRFNPRDSVVTNAKYLASLPSGGTNCSSALWHLNHHRAEGALVVYVSDNESWVDSPHYGRFGGSATATMKEWAQFKSRSPQAKLVCIDLQAYGSTQAAEREDILNIGGFSDQVFEIVGEFAAGHLGGEHWMQVIESVTL